MIQDEKNKSIKEQAGACEWKESARKKDKKRVPSDSKSSGEDSDNGEKESDADMKEIMTMFARSFKRGKFNRSRFS